MSSPKKVLILHVTAEERAIAGTQLADALADLGAEVLVQDMAAPYDDLLDAVVIADTIVFWR